VGMPHEGPAHPLNRQAHTSPPVTPPAAFPPSLSHPSALTGWWCLAWRGCRRSGRSWEGRSTCKRGGAGAGAGSQGQWGLLLQGLHGAVTAVQGDVHALCVRACVRERGVTAMRAANGKGRYIPTQSGARQSTTEYLQSKCSLSVGHTKFAMPMGQHIHQKANDNVTRACLLLLLHLNAHQAHDGAITSALCDQEPYPQQDQQS